VEGPRRLSANFLVLCLLLALAGCRNCDLVEAELRTRNNDLLELKSDLYRIEAENNALVHELQDRQGGQVGADRPFQTYAVKQIALGRQTGGLNHDGPGDDSLQLVVEPKDGDGHAIRSPGTLHVEAYDVSPEGLKNLSSSWEVTSDQLRRSWRSGLWSNNYTLVLPWKNWPAAEHVRVVVRFTGTDGRVFEADKDVTVRLAPAARRVPVLPATPPIEVPLPAPQKAPPTLPQPRKVENKDISKAWWKVPETPASIKQTGQWQPAESPALSESVQLLRPVPIEGHPQLKDDG
jgi:hypothetical protein